ncbi:MAG: hypothetical protein KGO02_11920, partial [Alphaproteobacteria bacterium]|nr:hypothetical protein [Alphaproteobacteria bacterium]
MMTRKYATFGLIFSLVVLGVVGSAAAHAEDVSALVVETQLRHGALPHRIDAYGVVAADPAVEQAVMAPVA